MTPTSDEKPLYKHGLRRCEHRATHFVVVTTVAGARVCRELCYVCGKLDSTSHKLVDHPNAQVVGALEVTMMTQWRTEREEAGAAAQALARQRFAIRAAARPAENADWFAGYSDFLAGDAWQAMRQRVLARDGSRCQAALAGCTRTATEVHHLDYRYHRKLGMEPAFNLRALCHQCHHAITVADRDKGKPT